MLCLQDAFKHSYELHGYIERASGNVLCPREFKFYISGIRLLSTQIMLCCSPRKNVDHDY